MSGRREQVARVIRRKLQQQREPVIIVLPEYATPPGGKPIVVWLSNHRAPTEAEIQEAIKKASAEEAAARQQQAATAQGRYKQSHPLPAQGSGEEGERR